MRFRLVILTLIYVSALLGCEKDDSGNIEDETNGMGTITFYVSKDPGGGYINISINGVYYGTLQYLTDRPRCNVSTGVSVYLEYGTYEVLATDNGGNRWQYTIDLNTNCILKKIE